MARLKQVLVVLAVAAMAIAGWEFIRGQPGEDGSVLKAATANVPDTPSNVTALGRLEPRDGAVRVAGASRSSLVVGQLLVEENDAVKEGQPLALLDTHALHRTEVDRRKAELANAESELHRSDSLRRDGVDSASLNDEWGMKVGVARATLRQSEAELALDIVRSPIDGQVLEVFARQGERVGPEGILEVGRTHEMFAVAEVYETDVGRVRLGQHATVRSAALPEPLAGTVAKIHAKVGKQDVLGTDPAARTDARVVEVEIRLDESERAAALANLEVDVEIEP